MKNYLKRIQRSLEGCRPKLSLGLDMFEEEYCVNFFGMLIALPCADYLVSDPEEIMDFWGVYYHESAIVLGWGSKTKFIHMPWEYSFIRRELLAKDGTWMLQSKDYYSLDGPEFELWEEEYPYTYTKINGDTQRVTATVTAERVEYRWKCLKWQSLFARRRAVIGVRFSDEVGESAGSWKGGTIGCGYTMRKGETPLECLRRMEREREFT